VVGGTFDLEFANNYYHGSTGGDLLVGILRDKKKQDRRYGITKPFTLKVSTGPPMARLLLVFLTG
jgi:hypothetical protein